MSILYWSVKTSLRFISEAVQKKQNTGVDMHDKVEGSLEC